MTHLHRFSTDQVPLPDRYEAWRARDWPNLAPILDTNAPDAPFDAQVHTLHLSHSTLAFSQMTSLQYSRDALRLRRDGVDHYGLMVVAKDDVVGEAGGRSFVAPGGSLVIGDFARTSQFRFRSSDAESVSISIARRAAETVIPDLANYHGRVIAPARAVMLADFLTSLHRNADRAQAADLPRLNRVLLDLTAAALGAEPPPEEDRVGDDARLWRARRLISAQLAARDLNVDLLCRKLRLSRATLYRLFEPVGGVAGYIRTQRLEAATRMLDDPQAQTIDDIARHCGFRDAAHLSRAYRAHYDETPRDRRERMRAR